MALADARAHPALGSGAGTYHQAWVERRPTANEAQDAHSLYLEVLAELGPIGLLLLAGTLALPFVRGRGLALGAYAAFVVQAGVDWEWELPAVTLAGLLCGVAALRSSPSNTVLLGTKLRTAGVLATLVLAAFALVGLAGNRAISRAADALRAERRSPRQGGGALGAPLGALVSGALPDRVAGPRRRRRAAARGDPQGSARLEPLGRARRRRKRPRTTAGGRDGRPPEPARRDSAYRLTVTCTSRRVETPASASSPALRARTKNVM